MTYGNGKGKKPEKTVCPISNIAMGTHDKRLTEVILLDGKKVKVNGDTLIARLGEIGCSAPRPGQEVNIATLLKRGSVITKSQATLIQRTLFGKNI